MQIPRNGLLRAASMTAARAAPIKFAHAVGHGALPGKTTFGTAATTAGPPSRQHPGLQTLTKRLPDRTQVTHAVVDNGNFTGSHQSAPLVEGMLFAARSSALTAMRSARPNAFEDRLRLMVALSPRSVST